VTGDLPTLTFAGAEDFDAWLAEHHGDAPGLWLRLAKKGAPTRTTSYADALEVALCWGWIDGQKRSLDEHFWLQRFTPRGPRSRWSRINRDKAEALVAAGRVQPPDRARADGRWEAAYAGQRTAEIPDDFAEALDRAPEARAFFEGLNSRNRYAFLHRIESVQRPQTRVAKIERYVAMLTEGRAIYP
jgi:uncharacterized protein YdeI (YjbR/CyaY-like superfamily)